MEKNSEIYKGKKKRVKSIALKANKESSDDKTSTSRSDDEEYAMAVRNFKKFLRRKGKFVRQPHEEKKSFRQRDDRKGKSDRKCFRCGLGFDKSKASTSETKPMTFVGSTAELAGDGSTIPGSVDPSTNQKVAEHVFSPHMSSRSDFVCLRTCLKLDEWIKDSGGCSRYMTGNKSLFSTYKAYNGGDESWAVAMQEELNQFIANDVWDLLPLPKNQSIIGTKWVYRNKLDENGIVSRNKAKLVAQGYNQQERIDYEETYAPVARLESILILLAIACANDFKLYQMDVKSAFLNGFINKEVYVAQPPSFIDFQKPNYVYKLKKALYGLKQAPKARCEYGVLMYDQLVHGVDQSIIYSVSADVDTVYSSKLGNGLEFIFVLGYGVLSRMIRRIGSQNQ
ncbi:retrovirus-related pol polyprotein from transposon TNT 1-94 [Tanacetum coccineum]